jgi:peptidoglycan/xylan/chitin deacetylase (PgdA/CDA1 family)
MTHRQLKKLSDEQVKEELAVATDRLVGMGETVPVSIALPFGISPKNRKLLESFDYKGKRYAFKAAMLVGANPAPSPASKRFDAFRVPRIQAYPGEAGSDYWLNQVAKGRVKVFVAP